MFNRTIRTLLLSIVMSGQLFAHTGKPQHHVVIDTDGALDDMRAISMFLSSNEIRVLSITCSQGTLLPDSTAAKVNSLLSVFHHEGIQVGTAERTEQQLPDWSSFAQNISWGNPSKKEVLNSHIDANYVLNRTTEAYGSKITFIALGSLKTYADWIKTNPQAIHQIDKIIWYNNLNIEDGFNFKVSPESFDYIRRTGIELIVVGNNSDRFVIDDSYIKSISNVNSRYAKQIDVVHKRATVEKHMSQNNLKFWDDIVPLYLTTPILFESENKGNIRLARINQNISASIVYDVVGEILKSSIKTNNRVFNSFPIDSSLYKPAYVGILNSTIKKFGLIEWKAISMTNEIHGHTGIYSIIGAKMGIRAMEYFNVGINNITVTTFAGHKPPLSCFNDGIQISTGATIGQGLISVSDSILTIPTATFEFNSVKVKIALKKEISELMQQDIKYGIKTYGLLTEKYWLYIEELAIRYWSDYSRIDVFDID